MTYILRSKIIHLVQRDFTLPQAEFYTPTGVLTPAAAGIKREEEKRMDIALIVKVAGVGILVSVATQILSKSGRDEQSMLVTLTGIVVVLLLLVDEIAVLFDRICTVFGF